LRLRQSCHEYLNGSDSRARQTLEDARKVKSRQADSVALLQEGKNAILATSWRT